MKLKNCDEPASDSVELILRPGHGKRGESLTERAFSLVRHFVGLLGTANEPEVFKVRGQPHAGEASWFDFLKDRFVFERHVLKLKGRYKSVSSPAMFAAIETAYNDHREELEAGTGLGDEET